MIANMISHTFRRIVLTNKHQLVPRTKFLFRHEQCSQLSYISHQTSLLNSIDHSTGSVKVNVVPVRMLCDASLLQIESLEHLQENTRQLLDKDREACISRIQKYIESEDRDCLLLEDLINLIGLAENVQHLDLIEKFISLMKDHLDLTGWSTTLMRLYYKMGLVDRAFNNLMDQEKFGQVFNTYTSYRIISTMLFDNDRHEEVVDLYHRAKESIKIKKRSTGELNNTEYPGLAIIAMASLARIAKPDSLTQAETIYSSIEWNHKLSLTQIRMKSFMAYIAIKNNQLAVALNMIAAASGKNYVTLKELKTIALIKLNRFEDLLHHLKTCQMTAQGKGVLLSDSYELIEDKLGEIENEQVQEEMTELLMEIKKEQLVNTETKLEDLVFKKLTSKRLTSNQTPQRNNSNYQNEHQYDSRNFRQHDRRRGQQRDNRRTAKSFLEDTNY